MDLPAVIVAAEELLELHGFAATGWTVRLERAFYRAGACDFDTKEILLNVDSMLAYTEDEVREIILHELGHAKVGPDAGHGVTWAQAVSDLGGTPKIKAPFHPPLTDWVGLYGILATLIYTGFFFAPLWGVLAVLVGVGIVGYRIWKSWGPIDQVYKLTAS